jgi:ATPase subunit of ABC transporter with duplicated ATPase domains
MSEPVLNSVASASGLVVRFGNQVVLDQATATILEGEHVGLVGRNGSGKSTFLQIAAGVMRPRRALIEHHRDVAPKRGLDFHRDLRREKRRRPIDMILKMCALFGDLPQFRSEKIW